MGVDFAKLSQNFMKCNVNQKREYVFDGEPLPQTAYEPDARACLAELVRSDAIPGPSCLYKLLGDNVSRFKRHLETFVKAQLVRRVGGGEYYQMTPRGLNALRSRVVCDEFIPCLNVRPGVALEDQTIWELMLQLGGQGWQAEIMPRGKPPAAVKTVGVLSDAERKWFYAQRTLTVPHSYLLALLTREELHKRGILF